MLPALALLAAACGGEDEPAAPGGGAAPPPAGPIPTATPLAGVPDPVVVTGGAPTAPGNGESEVIYVVEAGDALSLIAARFGVTVEVIQRANDLDGFDIFVGQELRIPRAGEVADDPAPTPTPPPASDDPNVHIVQSGDTPLGIAFQYDVTLEALEEANGGPGSLDVLQIGQEVRLPPRN